jgi:hypothetical protein
VNSQRGDTFSLNEISSWLRSVGFEDVTTIEAPGLAPSVDPGQKAEQVKWV